MTYTVIVEPEALADLTNIYQYILKQDSRNKASNFIHELQKSIASLKMMPSRCRKSHYSDDNNTRDLIYKGYTVVFKTVDDRVHILTLFRQKTF